MIKSEPKEKWYHHEMIICTIIALSLFGFIFLLVSLGVDYTKAAFIFGGLFLGIILLPLIDPIRDLAKWIKKRKEK